MPQTKHDGSALLVKEAETDIENAVIRAKSSMAMSGKIVGAALKARAVLGDICNNRLVNVPSKNDLTDNDCKKTAGKPLNRNKDLQNDLENVQQQSVACPEVSKQAFLPRRASFSSQNLCNIEDIDTEPCPQLVAMYVKDIYKYLGEMEVDMPIKACYMENYKIRPNMRAVLIDWMVGVHGRFRMLQETLYLTVAIMDRYLQADNTVVRQNIQLIGLTSMFIASKYEEMYSPPLSDFVFMGDKAFSKSDVLRTEICILKTLDFKLGRPLPLHFLRRYTKAANQVYDFVDVLHHTLSKYLMELSLPEYDFCHCRPSELAAAALCLSLKILDEHDTPVDVLWNDALVFYSGYTYEMLEPTVRKFCALLLKCETSKLQAIRKKYLVSRLYNISALPQFKSPNTINFLAKMALKH